MVIIIGIGSGGLLLLGAAHGHFFGGKIRWAEMPPMGGVCPWALFDPSITPRHSVPPAAEDDGDDSIIREHPTTLIHIIR
ncbi:MAG TPA: hypothetical protein VLA24_08975, partial [Pseudomonadales bacterium]|nr:hypothetical protein [Pseudomonadales bacterium]